MLYVSYKYQRDMYLCISIENMINQNVVSVEEIRNNKQTEKE